VNLRHSTGPEPRLPLAGGGHRSPSCAPLRAGRGLVRAAWARSCRAWARSCRAWARPTVWPSAPPAHSQWAAGPHFFWLGWAGLAILLAGRGAYLFALGVTAPPPTGAGSALPPV